jgi:Ca2+-transporting ATPase
MLPLHVALLELVIDPACSLAFENEPAPEKVMQQPPRDTRAALFGAKAIGLALGQGLCVLFAVGLTFYLAKLWPSADAMSWSILKTAPLEATALSAAQIRTMLFITLITGNAALILSNRAGAWQFWRSLCTPNAVAFGVIAMSGFFLALAIHWSWLSDPLQFEPLPPWPMLIALSSGLLSGFGISILQRYGKSAPRNSSS